jgi:hypothetical protein
MEEKKEIIRNRIFEKNRHKTYVKIDKEKDENWLRSSFSNIYSNLLSHFSIITFKDRVEYE